MSRAELIGYAAAGCVFVTFYMKTMVPLRIAGIVSNLLFIAYGYDLLAYPVLASANHSFVGRRKGRFVRAHP